MTQTTQTQTQNAYELFKTEFKAMEQQFRDFLPPHIPFQKFERTVLGAATMRPEILKAHRPTLWAEMTKCAQDGLLPDGREATINVYESPKGSGTYIAKYIPMVGGICKKARNSGEIKSIDAQVVYDKDTYEAWTDEKGSHFRHTRSYGERGAVRLTYAYVITKDGGFFFEEVDESQMGSIEKFAGGGDKSPWKGDFRDEMRRKSAIRRLMKYKVPSSADLDDVIRRDDDLYDPDKGKPEPQAPKEPGAPTRLEAAIGAAPEQKPAALATTAQKPVQPGNQVVEGVIDDIKVTSGTKGENSWVLHKVRINGNYYATFDKTIGASLGEFANSKAKVRLVYVREEKGDRVNLNVVSVEAAGAAPAASAAEGEGEAPI